MRYCDVSRFRTNNEERKCTYVFVYGPINACGDFFLSRSKNLYSCSLLSYTRTMFLDTFTPPTVRKWQQHHHYSWCRGLSRPVCIETMPVFLPLQFYNSIYLMLATASHPRRHHSVSPVSNSCQWLYQRVLFCFIDDDHICKSYPEYARKCERSFIFLMLNNTVLNFIA